MSDFLSHLASRAVSPVPVVRPLVRTPFELPAVGEPSSPAIVAPELRDSPPPPATPWPIQSTRDHDDDGIETRYSARPPAGNLSTPIADRQTPPSAAPLPVTMAPSAKPLLKNSPISLEATPAPETAPIAQPPARPGIPPVIQTISQPAATVPTAAVSISVSQPPDVPQALTKIPTVPSPANPPIRPRLEMTTRVSSRSRPAQAEAAATPQPAPQVTITIGRVEIRAAAPAEQTPPPAASGPAVSLETYLRRSATRSA